MRTSWATAFIGLVLLSAVVQTSAAKTPRNTMQTKESKLYKFRVKTIDGDTRSLADYRGKTLLIVNTASECGNTPQYKSLETIYQKYKDQGFEVLAFPANNFGAQEPGTNAEIKTFCSTNYHTTFPLFSKISVKGKDIAPLYRYLTTESAFRGDVTWNFAKFLVAPDGRIVARFSPKLDPLESELTDKIENTIAAGAGASETH